MYTKIISTCILFIRVEQVEQRYWMPNHGYQIWVVPLNLAGVLMDPVEQWKVEVRGVVVSEFSAGSPLVLYESRAFKGAV
jgi:hypothetical protein